jgi:hypothetical protein
MIDVLNILIVILFFLACYGLLIICDRLMEQ